MFMSVLGTYLWICFLFPSFTQEKSLDAARRFTSNTLQIFNISSILLSKLLTLLNIHKIHLQSNFSFKLLTYTLFLFPASTFLLSGSFFSFTLLASHFHLLHKKKTISLHCIRDTTRKLLLLHLLYFLSPWTTRTSSSLPLHRQDRHLHYGRSPRCFLFRAFLHKFLYKLSRALDKRLFN